MNLGRQASSRVEAHLAMQVLHHHHHSLQEVLLSRRLAVEARVEET